MISDRCWFGLVRWTSQWLRTLDSETNVQNQSALDLLDLVYTRTHANTHSSREIISLFCLSILFWSGSLSYSFFARVMFLRVVSFLLLFARPQKIKSKIENANLLEIYGRNCSIFCHDKLAHSRQIEPIAGMIEWTKERKKSLVHTKLKSETTKKSKRNKRT